MAPDSESPGIRYERPESVDEVRVLLDRHGTDAKITAGGQSLMLLMRQGLLDPDVVVDISEIPSLGGIDVTDDVVQVGATTTYDAVGRHGISSEFSALGDAIEVIADPQVRNMGTIGGGVSHADPSLDIPPNLLCLDASVRVGSVDGEREVPLSEFCTGYMDTELAANELVEAVVFPRHSDGWGGDYTKHSNVKGGWATVGVGTRVRTSGGRFEDVRVGLAAVAETAVRSPSVEERLTGTEVTDEALSDAAAAVVDDIDPLEDISGGVAYKEDLAVGLTERSLRNAVDRAGGTQ